MSWKTTGLRCWVKVKVFRAEAQKDVLDSYAQFILQFFTEENQMKEAFSIHRSVQMGEHWLTHRAYKDLATSRERFGSYVREGTSAFSRVVASFSFRERWAL